MVAQDIFLGSGASITKVPEVDIFIDGATRLQVEHSMELLLTKSM